MAKVELKKPKIKRSDDEETKQEKKITRFPVQKNKLLAIILKENKSSTWRWVDYNAEHFQVGKHTYFKEPSGTYLSDNKVLLAVYIEGVCIPVSHNYIEKEEVERVYVDPDGNEKKYKINIIANMKFDSEIADMLLHRHLADEFLKDPADKGVIVLIILMIIGIIFGVINMALQFLLPRGVVPYG